MKKCLPWLIVVIVILLAGLVYVNYPKKSENNIANKPNLYFLFGEQPSVGFRAENVVSPLKFEVVDEKDNLIRTLMIVSEPGIHGPGIVWDGRDADGSALYDTFRFRVSHGESFNDTLYSDFFDISWGP